MKARKMEADKVFRALGDAHRLQILELLMERERNAGELLEMVDVVQSTLSHHMKSLCESGLVISRKAGRWTYYSVSQEVVLEAQRFLKRYLGEESGEKHKGAAQAQLRKVEKAEEGEIAPEASEENRGDEEKTEGTEGTEKIEKTEETKRTEGTEKTEKTEKPEKKGKADKAKKKKGDKKGGKKQKKNGKK